MSATLQAGFFIGSMAVSALIFIPLFIKLWKGLQNRRERFRQYCEANGGKTIARYVPKSYSRIYEGNGKYTHRSSKYCYYGPDNKKYTKTFTHHSTRSHEIEIYVYPRNPKKAYTNYMLEKGGYDQFVLVLMWPITLIVGWQLFKLLCSIFG